MSMHNSHVPWRTTSDWALMPRFGMFPRSLGVNTRDSMVRLSSKILSSIIPWAISSGSKVGSVIRSGFLADSARLVALLGRKMVLKPDPTNDPLRAPRTPKMLGSVVGKGGCSGVAMIAWRPSAGGGTAESVATMDASTDWMAKFLAKGNDGVSLKKAGSSAVVKADTLRVSVAMVR